MFTTNSLAESIGKKLMAARIERGLSVEDVAFRTKIPASKLFELENDDFSNFANLTYAKGFLKLYSGFLDVDIGSYLDQFNTNDFANISGHDYIQSANTGMTRLSMATAPRRGNGDGRGKGLILILLLLTALIGFPIWYWSRPSKEPVKQVTEPVQQGPIPKAKPVLDLPEETAPAVNPAAVPVKPEAAAIPPKAVVKPEETQVSASGRPLEIRQAGVRAKIIPEDVPSPDPELPVPPPSAPTPTTPPTSGQ